METAQGRSKGPTAQAELEEQDILHGQELSAGPDWHSQGRTVPFIGLGGWEYCFLIKTQAGPEVGWCLL